MAFMPVLSLGIPSLPLSDPYSSRGEPEFWDVVGRVVIASLNRPELELAHPDSIGC